MTRGFGNVPAKQRKARKAKPQGFQNDKSNSQQRKSKIRQEIEEFLEKDKQENPDEYALAWALGVYNPLGQSVPNTARFLEPEEEDWLFLAKEVGWLLVDDILDAIYFTAPPPAFDPNQADWYIRPDLTTFLEEPERLKEAIHTYPIPLALLAATVEQQVQRLQWDAEKTTAFVQEITDRPISTLTVDDYTIILLELKHIPHEK